MLGFALPAHMCAWLGAAARAPPRLRGFVWVLGGRNRFACWPDQCGPCALPCGLTMHGRMWILLKVPANRKVLSGAFQVSMCAL